MKEDQVVTQTNVGPLEKNDDQTILSFNRRRSSTTFKTKHVISKLTK